MSEATIKQYNRTASQYEQRWKKYLNHTHNALLDRIDIDAPDSVLDTSGGTGLLAQLIIEGGYSFERFVINDPSVQMLDVARRRLADVGNIGFENKQADQLSYEPNSFDKIICLNSFHFYKNQQQVLEQFHAMLKAGGVLYVLDWNRAGFFRIVNQLIKSLRNTWIPDRWASSGRCLPAAVLIS